MYEYKIVDIIEKDIYDGDTIKATLDLGFGIYKKEKFRLARINAPELKGKNRQQGLQSRDFLRQLLLNNKNNLIIKTIKDRKGKYGRYIAEIYLQKENININNILLKEGLAVLY